MSVPPKLRFRVFARDGFVCLYCGRRPPEVKLHADHILPRNLGGQDVMENLTTACQDCNLGKGAMRLPEVDGDIDREWLAAVIVQLCRARFGDDIDDDADEHTRDYCISEVDPAPLLMIARISPDWRAVVRGWYAYGGYQ